ncbi:MAG: OmpA family protein [Ignavibacteria bacterium]|nr:OmpA family protein [Ignavibacteria bacterium]
MKKFLLILFTLTLFITTQSDAQFKDYVMKGGIQYNQLMPFSEFKASYSYTARAYLAFELSRLLAIEIGGGFGQYKTEDDFNTYSTGTSSDKNYVKSDIIPIDARLRISPGNSNNWNPYFYGGIGLMKYVTKELPVNPNVPDYFEDASGWTAFIPLGIGTEIRMSDNVMLDVSGGVTYPFTDLLNNFVMGSWEDASANLSLGLTFAGSDDCDTDTDKDGLTKCREEELGTNPNIADTDGDGLLDGEEVMTYMTNPLNKDTDGDTLWDGAEVKQHRTDPLKKDTDGDRLMDNEEINTYFTIPTDTDTDDDGLMDGDEVLTYKTDPKAFDTDLGTISDGVEVGRGTNPLDPSDDLPKPKEEPIKVGQVITLEGINFETNRSDISSFSEDILERALGYMRDNPELEVEISGHTDITGSREHNMGLSERRAESVKAWFVSKGISPSRIITVGYGPDQPVGSNDTEEGRFKNRRIDFKRIK